MSGMGEAALIADLEGRVAFLESRLTQTLEALDRSVKVSAKADELTTGRMAMLNARLLALEAEAAK